MPISGKFTLYFIFWRKDIAAALGLVTKFKTFLPTGLFTFVHLSAANIQMDSGVSHG